MTSSSPRSHQAVPGPGTAGTKLAPARKGRYEQLTRATDTTVIALQAAVVSTTTHRTQIDVERGGDHLVLRVGGATVHASNWLDWPCLCDAFIDGAAMHANTVGAQSAISNLRSLQTGFFSFLNETKKPKKLDLGHIDRRLVSEFVVWLARKDSNGFPVWALATRTGYLGALGSVFKGLARSKRWAKQISTRFSIPKEPWANVKGSKKAVPGFDSVTLLNLLQACHAEATKTMQSLAEAWNELEQCEFDLDLLARKIEDRTSWRIYYLLCYGDLLPCAKWLKFYDHRLVTAARKTGLSVSSLIRPFRPDGVDLIPFVILLAIYTSYNADTLRNILLNQIEYVASFAGRRIRLRANKGRSARQQYRSFAIGNPLGPDAIIDCIRHLTMWLRPIDTAIAEKLFIMVAYDRKSWGIASCGDFTDSAGIRAGKRWSANLNKFLEAHSIPKVTLAMMRKTSLEIVHQLMDGDLKALLVAGGQRNVQTILDSYTSDAAIKRGEEALAQNMAVRDRMIFGGQPMADPRVEPYTSDRGCATPGWRCFDPFDSPIAGEMPGKLCSAYARCPGCSMGHLDMKDPYSVARTLQLRDLINSSQDIVAPQRWIAVWAPVLIKLDDHWLPRICDTKVLQAAQLLTLSPLPELE